MGESVDSLLNLQSIFFKITIFYENLKKRELYLHQSAEPAKQFYQNHKTCILIANHFIYNVHEYCIYSSYKYYNQVKKKFITSRISVSLRSLQGELSPQHLAMMIFDIH